MANHVKTFLRRYPVTSAKAGKDVEPLSATTPDIAQSLPQPRTALLMPSHVGAPIEIAAEGEVLRRRLLTEARRRTRITTGEIHKALGQVLAGSADLMTLKPLQLLGLSLQMADNMREEGFRSGLEARGRKHYEEHYAPGTALTMLGVPKAQTGAEGELSLVKRLRNAGFTSAGESYAGVVNILQSVDLARSFSLTLLRYDSDHNATYFVRKGIDQPALVHLLAEHQSLIGQAIEAEAAFDTMPPSQEHEMDVFIEAVEEPLPGGESSALSDPLPNKAAAAEGRLEGTAQEPSKQRGPSNGFKSLGGRSTEL